MQILSARGLVDPGVARIKRRLERNGVPTASWNLSDNHLIRSCGSRGGTSVAYIPAEIIEGHERYYNACLAPCIYGHSRAVKHSDRDNNCFRSLNVAVSAHLNWADSEAPVLIVDYHFALVPQYLSEQVLSRSIFFAREPWPHLAELTASGAEHLLELALGMVSCAQINFTSANSLRNFQEFVRASLPGAVYGHQATNTLHLAGRVIRLAQGAPNIDYTFCPVSFDRISA